MNTLFPGDLNQLAAQLGIAVLLFFSLLALAAIMLIYIKSESRKWDKRDQHTSDIYKNIIDQISTAREKDFELLKKALDDNRDQVSILRGLVERMKAMQQQSDTAFRDLFTKVSTILENRCINQLKHSQKP